MKHFIFLLPFILSLFSCDTLTSGQEDSSYIVVTAPAQIKTFAFEFAKKYEESDTEYKWGGQSPLRAALQLDCSGLVVMCYKYAIENTEYSLIEDDMSSSFMYENASEPTSSPEQGDLIFMGEESSSKITHIAIFDKEENDYIYFIDSTENEEVNGVSERHYKKDNKKIKSFGVMKLKKKI